MEKQKKQTLNESIQKNWPPAKTLIVTYVKLGQVTVCISMATGNGGILLYTNASSRPYLHIY